jgi:hypothetical protein
MGKEKEAGAIDEVAAAFRPNSKQLTGVQRNGESNRVAAETYDAGVSASWKRRFNEVDKQFSDMSKDSGRMERKLALLTE